MGRKKKAETSSLVEILQDKYGQMAAITYDEVFSVNTIPTGIIALDKALGGGVPEGRMIELAGDPSSGKTTMALTIAGNAQKKYPDKSVLYIDVEHALDLEWAEVIGVSVTNQFIHSHPFTGEEALGILEDGLTSGQVSVAIVDSVAALMPGAEKEKDIGEANIGLQARLVATGIRRLNSEMPRHRESCVIFINQQRAQIGGGPSSLQYGPRKKSTGGMALPFYMTTRLKVTKVETLVDNPNDKNIVGQIVKVDVIKHKVLNGPGHKVTFSIDNKIGIDTAKELLEWGLANKRIKKSGSWFEMIDTSEKFQGEKTIKTYITENVMEQWLTELMI